jgi:hypothetical protein
VSARARADDRSVRRTVDEQRDRRDREDLVARGDLGVLVDVELRERDLAFALGLELVEDGVDRAARLRGARPARA